VVYVEKGITAILYFSASKESDVISEREEINQVAKIYISWSFFGGVEAANTYSQAQKTNINNDYEYSQAFATYQIEKLTELQLN
jgi:hypothetical protein